MSVSTLRFKTPAVVAAMALTAAARTLELGGPERLLRLAGDPRRRTGRRAQLARGHLFGGGLSPALVVTSSGGPHHYVSNTPYNHYSMLTTIED